MYMIWPLIPTTGQKCAISQNDKVWYLTPTFGGAAERICTISAGKVLFIIPAIDYTLILQLDFLFCVYVILFFICLDSPDPEIGSPGFCPK